MPPHIRTHRCSTTGISVNIYSLFNSKDNHAPLPLHTSASREILNAEVEDREPIPYDEEYYTELAAKYASTVAMEKKMAPEW